MHDENGHGPRGHGRLHRGKIDSPRCDRASALERNDASHLRILPLDDVVVVLVTGGKVHRNHHQGMVAQDVHHAGNGRGRNDDHLRPAREWTRGEVQIEQRSNRQSHHHRFSFRDIGLFGRRRRRLAFGSIRTAIVVVVVVVVFFPVASLVWNLHKVPQARSDIKPLIGVHVLVHTEGARECHTRHSAYVCGMRFRVAFGISDRGAGGFVAVVRVSKRLREGDGGAGGVRVVAIAAVAIPALGVRLGETFVAVVVLLCIVLVSIVIKLGWFGGIRKQRLLFLADVCFWNHGGLPSLKFCRCTHDATFGRWIIAHGDPPRRRR
mmetsp:Transcript_31848/g.66760  ORF Transcript_31848/g.66760 Transcript_31848/m.66760 type:complete len:322 (+) Transcript_31848:996-1961(+)